MPSAYAQGYGVTSRQQDGAALQQDKTKKNPFREAILFRRSRIKRPKEALLIIISNSRPRRASFFALLCALLWLIFSLLCVLGVPLWFISLPIRAHP